MKQGIENLKELLRAYHPKDICKDGYGRALGAKNIEALADYYLTMPDWCMRRNFPKMEILREYSKGLEYKGIFVGKDFHGETIRGIQTCIFHDCQGMVNVEMDYDKSIIPMLYFANGCQMQITCEQTENKNAPITIPLYVFGGNNLIAEDNEYAEFITYKKNTI